MRRFFAFTSVLALGALCSVVLASCGGSSGGGISSASADVLLDLLDEVDQAIADGNCDVAAENADAAIVGIENATPAQIDPDMQTALIDGFQRLGSLADDPSQCSGAESDTTTTDETTTEEEPETVPETTQEAPVTPTPPDTGDTQTDTGGGTGGGTGDGGTGGTGAGGVSP